MPGLASTQNYFTLVNTDEVNGARVRLRYYEGRGSNEVLDFDVCLSKGDKFTAVIQKATTGEMQVCRIDNQNRILDGDTPWVIGSGAPCVNAKFGSQALNNTITATDTLEGYFVAISENQLTSVASGGTCGATLLDNFVALVGNVLTGGSYLCQPRIKGALWL